MHHLSNRTKMLLSAALAVGLVALSVTACSPHGTQGTTSDSKTGSQQRLQPDNSAAEIASNPQEPSDTNQQPNSSPDGQNAEAEALTQAQKDFYISQYIAMNPLTFQSWSDPETIESFRYGTFYGQNALHHAKYSPEQYAIEDTPNYEIPQNIFEEFIQLYFNVSSDYLRTSRFYDSEKEIYTGFLAGGGIPVEYTVESVQKNGSLDEITYIATDENGSTTITIGIDQSGDHDKFVYVKRSSP